jgi:hypothetical protein
MENAYKSLVGKSAGRNNWKDIGMYGWMTSKQNFVNRTKSEAVTLWPDLMITMMKFLIP